MNPIQVSNNLRKVVRVAFALTTSTIVGEVAANVRSEGNTSVVGRLETSDIMSFESTNLSPSGQFTSELFLRSEEVYDDLRSVEQEAEDEDFPAPSMTAKRTAESLLSYVVGFAGPVSVYPTIDGEIAIDAYSNRGSVVFLCESSGNVFYMSNVDGVQESKRFKLREELPLDSSISDNLVSLYAS